MSTKSKQVKKSFSINIPQNSILNNFKSVGHFFLDHIFILFKIKCYFEENHNYSITNIIIDNYDLLKKEIPFMDDFYKAIFNTINDKSETDNIIDLGIIMGSVVDSEKDKLYLAHTSLKTDIPKDYLLNGRHINELHKKYGLKLQEILLPYFISSNNKKKESNEILILDNKNGRTMVNTQVLKNFLEKNKYSFKIAYIDDYSLKELINLVNSNNIIISTSGIPAVLVSFMKPNSKYIEFCESGWRYPNTAIYGHRYNIDTFNLCLPLRSELQQYKQIDEISLQLDYLCNEYPNIITNSEKDIKREKYWYSLILNKCEKYFEIHMIQKYLCNEYIEALEKLFKSRFTV